MSTFAASPSNWTNSSDANFRAWGSYVAAQMAAVGLVQTADTGQINWTTVTTPAGINTFQGYEIWRFADTLQATAPVYIKIEYGESSTVDGPAIRIAFGSGSDGVGNLTGTTSSAVTSMSNATAAATTVRGSGSTGRFVIAVDYSSGFLFGFERSKDATGADTSEAVILIYKPTAPNTNCNTQAWDTTIGTKSGNPVTGLGALFPAASSFASGSQIGVAPIMPEKPIFMNPILNGVGYYTGDISTSTTFVAYMYGVAHQYYALTTGVVTGAAFRGIGAGTESLGIRYE